MPQSFRTDSRVGTQSKSVRHNSFVDLWHFAGFVFGLIALAACTIVFFWKTTNVGFLLDDYLHVGYLNDAVHGHPAELLKRMYSMWSFTTDSLCAYRPGLTLSFWCDYAAGGGSPVLMHITNIVLTAASSVFVALIGLELSLAFNFDRKYLTALAAGVLFAVYPLHPEATAWIAGRADVFSSLLYLVTVWGFLFFRRTENRAVFIGSLVAFFVSLTMKEMPATCPLAIVLAALLVYPGTKLKHIAAYWGVLGAFAVIRTAVIGQVVGGYGDVGGISIKQIIRNYLDKESFLKLLFGATEELPVPDYLHMLNYYALSLTGLLGLSAAVTNVRAARLVLFLLGWTAVTLLPAFQIWHIFPNLVGSRMFWIGSAPLCLLLAFSAAACMENLPKTPVRLPVGVVALAMLGYAWSYALQINLIPWVVTGQQLTNLRQQVQTVARQIPPGKRALFANIPQDHQGVPELGRPEFLERLCKQPFSDVDLSDRIITAQRPLAGGHEFTYPRLLADLRNDTPCSFVWDDTTGSYYPLVYSGQKEPANLNLDEPTARTLQCEPPLDLQSSAKWSRLSPNTATIGSDGLELHVGRKGLTVWLPEVLNKISGGTQADNGVSNNAIESGSPRPHLRHRRLRGVYARQLAEDASKQPQVTQPGVDPSALTCVQVETDFSDSFELEGAHAPNLIWQSAGIIPERNSGITDTLAASFFRDGKLTYMPGRKKSWSLQLHITRLGLAFPPGDYFVKIKSVNLLAQSPVEPQLAVSIQPQPVGASLAHEHWLTTVDANSIITFDATNVLKETRACDRVQVVITKAWQALPDLACSNLSNEKTIACTYDIAGASGQFTLPELVLKQKGVHQLAIIPLDANGKPCGVLSEPRSVLVP